MKPNTNLAMTGGRNNNVLDRVKYLESIISTFKSLDDVIYKEIQNGTDESIVKILDRQIEVLFRCISEFEPESDKERIMLLEFSIDMVQDRVENRLATACLEIIRRNIGSVSSSH